MKVCILSTTNIKHMTLVSLYTDFFKLHSIDFDIIYVDKYEIEEKINARNKYKFKLKIQRDWPIIKKIIKYYSFANYAKKIIKNNKYDYLIVWNTFTAFLFFPYLPIKYKGRYSLNIRDYFKEKNILFYYIHKKLILNSDMTTISSKGFLSFLPKGNYLFNHSLNLNLLELQNISKNYNNDVLTISFIGYVRFIDNDKKLIDELGNDPRFILKFIGEGSQYLKEYVEEKKFNNIKCIESFNHEDTAFLIEDADIINNLYGKNEIALDTAISIKFYYALLLKIPILTYKGTFINEEAESLGMSIGIDNIEGSADFIYNSYYSIDKNELRKNCNGYIDNVLEQKKEWNTILQDRFLHKEEKNG